jgi:hypothetical protein
VGNEAVKRKFEEAQRDNDSVKLTVLRGGKELKCEHCGLSALNIFLPAVYRHNRAPLIFL